MQRVNAHVQDIPVAIKKLYGILCFSLNIDALQASKSSNTMIDMGDVIANFQLSQRL